MKKMKICKKCNIEYSDDKKFCRSCGSPLNNMASLETADSAKKEVLEERLKSDPLNIELLQEYASFLLNIELFKESIKASLKILAISENNISAKKSLYDAYFKLGEYNKAESVGKQLLSLEPNEISHIKKLVEIAINLENWDKAIVYIDDILEKQPSDIAARQDKMKVFIEMGELLAAADIAKTLYHEGVRDKTTIIYAGIADALSGEYTSAIELLKPTLKNVDFESENIHYHRGLLYLTYSLCRDNSMLTEIENVYPKLDTRFIKETNIPADKEIAVSVVNYIIGGKLKEISAAPSAKNEIDTLISLYLNKLPDSDKNNSVIAELWFSIGMKQKEFNLISSSLNSFQKAVALNSKEDKYKEAQKESEDVLRKAKEKKKRRTIFQASLIVAVIAVLIGSFFIYESIKIENDWTKNNLKGEVKSVKSSIFKAVDRHGEIEKGEAPWPNSINYLIFDQEGKMIEEDICKSDGSLDSKKLYKYDDNSNMIEENWCHPDGRILSNRIFKYDNNGNMIEENYFSSGGSPDSKYLYKFDDNGNMIEKYSAYNDQVLYRERLYIYDDNGKMIEEQYFRRSVDRFHMKTLYKYSNNGKMIEESVFNSDESPSRKFIYNENGNIIEYYYYNSEGFDSKNLYKYDTNGNKIEENQFNSDGNLEWQRLYKYEYDYKGNWIKKTGLHYITEREIEYYN
ncbi:MAG: hypothetical protein WC199_05595 [Dysgonamonadaceae bacterium]